MAKNEIKLTYTFVDPNTPKAFENTLKKILIDKLLAQPPKTTFGKADQSVSKQKISADNFQSAR